MHIPYVLAPGDYSGLSANITFSPGGDSTICVNVTVFEDQTVEDQEFFFCVLSSSDSAADLVPPTQITVILLDSSGKCDMDPMEARYCTVYYVIYTHVV